MTRESLRKRLEALDMSKAPIRPATADFEGGTRLRATMAAAFGLSARGMFGNDCPALQWLHRCREGNATQEDRALLDEISAVRYFDPPVETVDYLMALSRLYRAV